MTDSITIDVGGQIFKTHISTLTKFPESLLATKIKACHHGGQWQRQKMEFISWMPIPSTLEKSLII